MRSPANGAFAGEGQRWDPGAKMVQAAPKTRSSTISTSVACGAGRSSNRGPVQIMDCAHGSACNVRCDAMLGDTTNRLDTHPYVDSPRGRRDDGRQGAVPKICDDQLSYVMSGGPVHAHDRPWIHRAHRT